MPVKGGLGWEQVEARPRSVKGREVERVGAKGRQRSGKARVEVRPAVGKGRAAELS